MINLNDIYELIRKSLIIKEAFNNGIYSNNLENELYKISQEINDKKTKEICNSLLGITHLKNNRYSLSENELHSVINYIKENETKLNIKEEYDKIKDTIKRSSNLIYLNEYSNFDSIDERMKRVPNDLNDPKIREEYIRNHIEWFLKNHPDAVDDFMQEVRLKYETKMKESGQMSLFDLFGAELTGTTD